MIGIDMVFIPRFENKPDLAKKVLTENEFLAYQQCERPAEFLASRFAAKEAFLKAMGEGLFTIPWKAMEVRKDTSGKPHFFYLEKEVCEVSIAHEHEYAIAMVMMK